jgi:flagellar biosynthesis/type III secretory pathway chaperone
MIAVDDRTLHLALHRHLQSEVKIHRELAAIAEGKNSLLVDNKVEEFSALVEREKGVLDKAVELRRFRDDLLRRIGERMQVHPRELTLTAILPQVDQPVRGDIEQEREELNTTMGKLQMLNDRNQMLLRTGLGFVSDLINTLAGTEQREAYDRAGARGTARSAGGLLNSKA